MDIRIPSDLLDCFQAVSQENTDKNIETLALLCGTMVGYVEV